MGKRIIQAGVRLYIRETSTRICLRWSL